MTALLLAALRVAARADDASPPPPSGDDRPRVPVERIEVVGDAGEAPRLDATAFATVIRAEEFAGRVTTVEELLRAVVGVQVASLGGSYATVSIRGSSAEQVVVYLDGVPLNRALGGGVNLADLPVGQVESIELYRGFTPAGLSLASIGGAVMIHTRRREDARGTARLSAGSFGSAEASLRLAGRRGGSEFAVGAGGGVTGGDFAYRDTNGTEFDTTDDATARRVNNDARSAHLSGRWSAAVGGRARVAVTTDSLRKEQGVPGADNFLSASARFKTARDLVRAEIEVPGYLAGRLLLRGAADFTRYAEAYDDALGEIGFSSGIRTDNTLRARGLEAGLTLVATRRQAWSILVADRRESAVLRSDLDAGGSDLGAPRRVSTIVTVEDQISAWGERLVLNPSLRREVHASAFRPGDATGTVPPSLDGRTGETSGKIGARLRLHPAVTLKANAGSFVRVPDFLELFGNRGSISGNPALLPERGRSADLGAEAVVVRPGRALRRVRVETSLFRTEADNLILFVPVAQGVVHALNSQTAAIDGLELALDLGLGKRLDATLNATHQRAVYVGGVNDGHALPGRPADEAAAGLSLDLGRRGRLAWSVTYVGRNFVNPSNIASAAIPYRVLHDLSWRFAPRPGLEVVAEVKNVGDDITYDVARYPLPGRSFHIKTTWDF